MEYPNPGVRIVSFGDAGAFFGRTDGHQMQSDGIRSSCWLTVRNTAAGTALAGFSAAEMIISAPKKLVGKAEMIVSALEESSVVSQK